MVLDSYGLMFSEGRRLSVSATMLSIPVVCWMLGPKSSSMSIHRMSIWDALIVASWTRFLWSENKSISYPKRLTRDYLRHLKLKISSLFVAVKFNFVFGSFWFGSWLFFGSYFHTHGFLPFILPLLGSQKSGIVWIHVDLCGQNKTSAVDVGLFLV